MVIPVNPSKRLRPSQSRSRDQDIEIVEHPGTRDRVPAPKAAPPKAGRPSGRAAAMNRGTSG